MVWLGRLRVVTSEVSPVAHGQAARSVHPDGVLVVLEHFHDRPCLVPLRWVAAGLILNEDRVTATKGGQAVGVLIPSGSSQYLSL